MYIHTEHKSEVVCLDSARQPDRLPRVAEAPDKHRKTIGYYGIYASGIKEKLELIENKIWRFAVEHCFNADPVKCPDCKLPMIQDTVYSFYAQKAIEKLVKTHRIVKGYFRPLNRPP